MKLMFMETSYPAVTHKSYFSIELILILSIEPPNNNYSSQKQLFHFSKHFLFLQVSFSLSYILTRQNQVLTDIGNHRHKLDKKKSIPPTQKDKCHSNLSEHAHLV